jgi:nitrate reductase NapD
MNISSVVIRAHPDKLAAVQASLLAMPGVEIHAVTAESRIAATLEDADTRRAADAYVALHEIPGVLTVTLIYQYDDADEGVAIPPGLLDGRTAEALTATPAGQTSTF